MSSMAFEVRPRFVLAIQQSQVVPIPRAVTWGEVAP